MGGLVVIWPAFWYDDGKNTGKERSLCHAGTSQSLSAGAPGGPPRPGISLPAHAGAQGKYCAGPYLKTLGAQLDITELQTFDDLHGPSGVLAKTMDRAAALWGSRKSYPGQRQHRRPAGGHPGGHPTGGQDPGGPPLPQGHLPCHGALRPGSRLPAALRGRDLRHCRFPHAGPGSPGPGGAPPM